MLRVLMKLRSGGPKLFDMFSSIEAAGYQSYWRAAADVCRDRRSELKQGMETGSTLGRTVLDRLYLSSSYCMLVLIRVHLISLPCHLYLCFTWRSCTV